MACACADRTQLSGLTDELVYAEPLSQSRAVVIAAGVSALGGAALGWAASGSGRGAKTGALIGLGLEATAYGSTILFRSQSPDAVDAATHTAIGAITLLGGLIGLGVGGAMAYNNIKRGRRR